MTAKKKNIIKKSNKVTKEESEVEDIPVVPGKKMANKKPLDIEAVIETTAVIDDKIDEDVLPGEGDEESAEESMDLDDEELNPFGDKWEQ